jgi:hypothetical protein
MILSACLAIKGSTAEIRIELREAVYGQNVMSEGTVRQWCKTLKD